MQKISTDICIIGSGMGGGIISRALSEMGREVLIVEKGDRLPQEDANWDASKVFLENKYKNAENWLDKNGKEFKPGVHYYVGGNTKVYGASLIRFREFDFEEFQTPDGLSPEWPFKYSDLEPYYAKAESYLRVRGEAGADAFDPSRSTEYKYPAIKNEPFMEKFAGKLKKQGLHPYSMAMGVELGSNGNCIRCATCDGYPCKIGAKNDAETCGVNPALATGNAKLLTRCEIIYLVHDDSGKFITKAFGLIDSKPVEITAKTFILSGGAANSAALLLKSKSNLFPNGLANSSGLVGRNWMVHNATFMVGFNPFRRNTTKFQKTLSFNDWYGAERFNYPLGNVQMLGRLNWQIFKSAKPYLPKFFLKWFAAHTIDLYLESEDLPRLNNKVSINESGKIIIEWTPNNLKAHKKLIAETKKAMRKAGYPLVIAQTMGIETNSHQCGTAVAGHDPKTSVLNEFCRTHDHENLFVVDSSFFPSSAAANPALTIAAQAIRVAEKGGIA